MICRLVLASLMLVAAYVSMQWGRADYHDQQAKEIIESWRQGEKISDTWDRAYDAVENAIQVDEFNPAILQRKAMLLRVRILTGNLEPLEKSQLAAQAIDLLERAIFVRPNWASTWADLAYLKRIVSQKDEKYLEAIHTAVRVGPWEPASIEILSFMGLRDYAFLSVDLQQLVIKNVVRGLRSPVDGTFENTFDRVNATPALGEVIVSELSTSLTLPWRDSTRYNYFLLADWSWQHLNEKQKTQVVFNALEVIRTLKPSYIWIKVVKNTDFKDRLCVEAASESPTNSNLNVWCR